MKKTRKLTAAALIAALSVVLVLLAGISPTSKLAIVAAAGAVSAFIVAESGPLYGLAVWAVTSLITILSAQTCGIVYFIFFGWYPSLKCIIERINKRVPEWILKICAFSVSFIALKLLFTNVLDEMFTKYSQLTIVLYLVGCAGFVLYDICLSMFISYYLRVIYPKIRK